MAAAGAKVFDPSQVQGCGLLGQKTAKMMADALIRHGYSVSYGDKVFTILNSSQAKTESIVNILFNEKMQYNGWVPKVLDKTDALGNRLVELISNSQIREWEGDTLCLEEGDVGVELGPEDLKKLGYARVLSGGLSFDEIAKVVISGIIEFPFQKL
jgi:hypothetical protein